MAKDPTKNINKYSELEYRRRWLYQLQSEFKQICSWYKISLATPAFRLIDSRMTLGSWNPETRTISISAILINEYSWDTVINVLKHEMAHQYVHEFLQRGMELPHGPAFLESCEKLGVLHPFNTASGDTPKIFTDTKQHGSDTEYNNKVNKVRKMLSLAGSDMRRPQQ
jgi:predicted SprT family Zn-dependent metalloprotease